MNEFDKIDANVPEIKSPLISYSLVIAVLIKS